MKSKRILVSWDFYDKLKHKKLELEEKEQRNYTWLKFSKKINIDVTPDFNNLKLNYKKNDKKKKKIPF